MPSHVADINSSEMAAAVGEAHKKGGILHCDMHPGNMHVAYKDGKPHGKLLDWDRAKVPKTVKEKKEHSPLCSERSLPSAEPLPPSSENPPSSSGPPPECSVSQYLRSKCS